jgi:hypothetical protein
MATIRAATQDRSPRYTPTGETPVEQAVRHVLEGEVDLERQRRILTELRADGHPTSEAEQLLAALEATQENHKAHLRQLVGGLEASGQAAANGR